MSGITLTAAQRSTLLTLSGVSDLFNQTQSRLNSGKKVNSVTDDAVAFFRSQSLTNRSSDILNRKNDTDQSVQAVSAALQGTSAVDGLLKQLKGVLSTAQGAQTNQRVAATQQFKDIAKQLAQVVKDTSFQGLNILTSSSSTLTTQFSERTAATFTISGFNLTATTSGSSRTLFTQSTAVFKSDGSLTFSALVNDGTATNAVTGFSQLDTQNGTTTIKATIAQAIFAQTSKAIDAAISQLRGVSSALGTNVAILKSRSTFSTNYSNVLQTASDKLTLADLNTEAANSQALQLRQQLGISSLSTAGSQNQSILSLLR